MPISRCRIHPTEVFALRADGWTLQQLADRYGVTHGGVCAYLSRTRTRVNHPRVPKHCLCGCGQLTICRKFASRACYFRHITQGRRYVSWRHGQRLARAAVGEVFPLRPGTVVHHIDGDTRHNALENLWVFRSQAEHMSYHRGGRGQPIWRGDLHRELSLSA